jgi:type II secretory pathway predicted ATPase ExeA
MNWFSRIFRRNQREDGYDDYVGAAVEWSDHPPILPAPVLPGVVEPVSGVPGFASSANSLVGMTGQVGRDPTRIAYRRAFLPSQPVASASDFAGRTELLRRVIRAIEDQHLHVVVYGDRGIGKTSVLRVVRELAVRAKYVVQYTSCGEETDFAETFRAIAARIPLLYDAEFDPSVDEVAKGGTLADKLPAGNFTVSQLSELMATIAGTRVLVILDEFDRATSPRFRSAMAELIKNLSDRSIPVQLLIAGVAANLTDLIAHVPSIRRNIVGIGVPNMTDAEVRDLIAIGEKAGGIRFTAKALDRLVADSAGLPYLAALLGQHATLAASEAGAAEVDVAHVLTARARAVDDIGSRLSPMVQYALADAAVLTSGGPLAGAAKEAVHNGGIIAATALAADIAALPAAQAALFERSADVPHEVWRFAEDGVSTFIWLKTR